MTDTISRTRRRRRSIDISIYRRGCEVDCCFVCLLALRGGSGESPNLDLDLRCLCDTEPRHDRLWYYQTANREGRAASKVIRGTMSDQIDQEQDVVVARFVVNPSQRPLAPDATMPGPCCDRGSSGWTLFYAQTATSREKACFTLARDRHNLHELQQPHTRHDLERAPQRREHLQSSSVPEKSPIPDMLPSAHPALSTSTFCPTE